MSWPDAAAGVGQGGVRAVAGNGVPHAPEADGGGLGVELGGQLGPGDASLDPRRRRPWSTLAGCRPSDDAIILGDNLEVLARFGDGHFQMAYLDPPFNTGTTQTRRTLRTTGAPTEPAIGSASAGGPTPRAAVESSYRDTSTTTSPSWSRDCARCRVLLVRGTLFLHLDYREVHYVKVLLDGIFGRECFLNEIIWAYDYGAPPQESLARQARHYPGLRQGPENYIFDSDAVDRVPYMAPGLVTPEKAARGKLPTDVWWHTIVPTNGREKTGYPTQKPEGVLRRIVHRVLARPGDCVPRLLRRQRHASARSPPARPRGTCSSTRTRRRSG